MSGSCLGASLTDLYYEHAEEVSEMLMNDQGLKMVTANLVEEIVEKADTLNSSGTVRIDRELVESILDLADKIAAHASPELKRAIAKVKKEIKKEYIFEQMGVTITE